MAMTYGQVRDFVRAQAGDDCAQQASLSLFMVNALESLNNKLGEEEVNKFASVSLSPTSPSWGLPPNVDNVLALVDDQGCMLPLANLPCLRCTSGAAHPGRPTSFRQEGRTLLFHPVPDKAYTFRAEYRNTLDTTLFDTDPQGVINWRTVNLHEGLHTIFAKMVLGLTLMDTDAARAQNWLTVAEQEFYGWKQRQMTGAEMVWGRRPMSRRKYGNSESLSTIINPR